jgi:hypothetical protein
MNGEKEALLRVQGGLFHLRKGLAPFVEARMTARFGADWLLHARRAQGDSSSGELDAYGLLKTMIDHWRDVFAEGFSRDDQYRVRCFTSMALEARNTTSHLSAPLPDGAALRYLDAMHELLKATKAAGAEIDELKRLYDQQRWSGLATSGAGPDTRLDRHRENVPPRSGPLALLPPSMPEHDAARMLPREAIADVNRRCRAASLTREDTRFANVNSATPRWWLDIPMSKFATPRRQDIIHLVLNHAAEQRVFHLPVPSAYFLDNVRKWTQRPEKSAISLQLSVIDRDRFRDQRSGLPFAHFLCPCSR